MTSKLCFIQTPTNKHVFNYKRYIKYISFQGIKTVLNFSKDTKYLTNFNQEVYNE